jgi:hypothetical protein
MQGNIEFPDVALGTIATNGHGYSYYFDDVEPARLIS